MVDFLFGEIDLQNRHWARVADGYGVEQGVIGHDLFPRVQGDVEVLILFPFLERALV